MESRARITITILLGALMLLVPAIYNGYPFLTADSATYTLAAARGDIPWIRPVIYSHAIYPLHQLTSLWPVVVFHSLIIAHIIYLTLRTSLGSVSPAVYLCVLTILTLATSLPWIADMIMTDAFGSVAVLALVLLGMSWDKLLRGERIYLFVLAVAAISFNFAFLPMALGAAIVVLVLNAFVSGFRGAIQACIGAIVPALLALGLVLTSNAINFGVERATGYGQIFALARFQADGLATEYLHDECPEAGYRLCDYLDMLPLESNRFLSESLNPLISIGGAQVLADEATEIVYGSLLARPWAHARSALKNTLHQLLRLRTSPSFDPLTSYPSAYGMLTRAFPGEAGAIASARQQTRTLNLRLFDNLHSGATIAAGAISLILLVPLVRRNGQRVAAMIVVVFAALAINAFITGTLARVLTRYNVRMTWLLVLVAMVAVLWLARSYRDHRRQTRRLRVDPETG